MWRNLFILYFVLVKKQRTIERKKKRSKISGLESCYANRMYVLIGVELRPYGQKLVKFCTQTHTHTHRHTHAAKLVVEIKYLGWRELPMRILQKVTLLGLLLLLIYCVFYVLFSCIILYLYCYQCYAV